MKLRHIFAAIATAGILVSCSKTKESYIEEMCDLKNEAADIIMNCHTWDDAFDAADKLHAIADEMKELEEDGVISRMMYPVVPPKTEYSLTETGQTLVPIVDALCKWGEHYFELAGVSVPWEG